MLPKKPYIYCIRVRNRQYFTDSLLDAIVTWFDFLMDYRSIPKIEKVYH